MRRYPHLRISVRGPGPSGTSTHLTRQLPGTHDARPDDRIVAAAPGQIERVDYEYRRCGTVNLFVAVDAHRPWRKVSVTQKRTAQDYAERLRELVDVDYPGATCIRVVQDNLSTHTPGALYEAFPAPEAHRILERLEFHYTPKHASWLNMVEIEIGVL